MSQGSRLATRRKRQSARSTLRDCRQMTPSRLTPCWSTHSCPRSVRLDRFVGQLLERLTHFPECVVVAIDRIFRLENLRLDIRQPHLPAVVLPREHLHRQFDADPSIRLHQGGTQLWVSEYQELGGLECLADFLCGCRMVNSSCNPDASCLEHLG